MSTFLSSPHDNDDYIIIIWLQLAVYNPFGNTMPLFSERLTVDEVRRRSGKKIWHRPLKHPFSSPFCTLFNSNHDDALITSSGLDHAIFELLHQIFKPCFDSFTSYREILISFNSKIRSAQTPVFHHLSGACVGMD